MILAPLLLLACTEKPAPVPPCAALPPPLDPPVTLQLRLVRSPEVPPVRVRAQAGRLTDTLRPYGLQIEVVGEAMGPPGPLLVDADSEPQVLAPLHTAVAALALPARPEILLFLVDRLAAPTGPATRLAPELAGLALGPGNPLAGQPDPFTPMILLSDHDLARRAPPDTVAAHEFGHLLGLPHRAEAGALMAQGEERGGCTPTFSATELLQLALPDASLSL